MLNKRIILQQQGWDHRENIKYGKTLNEELLNEDSTVSFKKIACNDNIWFERL
jgi:hypothetical protein